MNRVLDTVAFTSPVIASSPLSAAAASASKANRISEFDLRLSCHTHNDR